VPAERHDGVFADAVLPTNPAVGEANRTDKAPWLQTLTRDLMPADHACIDHHRKNGLEAMLSVDDLIGTIERGLQQNDLANDTAIVFLSDNGYLWGEHGLVAKRLPYEQAVRVPFYVHYSGFRTGADDSCIVTNNDVAPTLLTLAGATVPGSMDGRDMGAWLRTGATGGCREATLLEYHPGPGSTPPGFDVVRTDRYKFIQYANGQRELYDLADDPYELSSLARDAEHAAVVELMDRWMDELTACAGAACRQAEDTQPAARAVDDDADGDPAGGDAPLPAAVALVALAAGARLIRRRP
jgi:arylsulfatase A-like enzyme